MLSFRDELRDGVMEGRGVVLVALEDELRVFLVD